MVFWLRQGMAIQPLLLIVGATAVRIAAAILARDLLLRHFDTSARSFLGRWTTRPPAGEIVAMFGYKTMAQCFSLHVLCWYLGAAETWVIFRLMRHPVSLTEALVIDNFAYTLRTFGFFVPAAARVQEGAYIVVGALIGISPAAALAFSLARRAREIALGVPGLVLWQYWEAAALSGRRRAVPLPQSRAGRRRDAQSPWSG
jgi:uncharacterized membrane protein YbhN (UPF0104 family)